MELLIHTYGRPYRQSTWKNLGDARRWAKLVVQHREAHLYPDYPKIVLPEHLTTLAETRQWIYTEYEGSDKIVILDDDLQFAIRRDDDPTKFVPATDAHMDLVFSEMKDILGWSSPLVGVAAREGANRVTDHFVTCTRQMRIHGIHVPTYRRLNVKFNRVVVMEDFDVTLQFLRHGYDNHVINWAVSNQAGSNTEGGCSHYRTPEVQDESARKLAELHPGLVSVVTKPAKNWGWEERTDVIVRWKRARQTPYEAST